MLLISKAEGVLANEGRNKEGGVERDSCMRQVPQLDVPNDRLSGHVGHDLIENYLVAGGITFRQRRGENRQTLRARGVSG